MTGLCRRGQEAQIDELTGGVLCISAKGRPIKPKTIGQKKYIESVLKNTVTIGVGPAGRQDLPGGGRRCGGLPG